MNEAITDTENVIAMRDVHTVWVCLSTSQLKVQTHIPLINPATKMKLYKYLPTPMEKHI